MWPEAGWLARQFDHAKEDARKLLRKVWSEVR